MRAAFDFHGIPVYVDDRIPHSVNDGLGWFIPAGVDPEAFITALYGPPRYAFM
jgi:hypothetical protein